MTTPPAKQIFVPDSSMPSPSFHDVPLVAAQVQATRYDYGSLSRLVAMLDRRWREVQCGPQDHLREITPGSSANGKLTPGKSTSARTSICGRKVIHLRRL